MHTEVSVGGLALIPGTGMVSSTVFDPPPTDFTSGGIRTVRSGGLRQWRTDDGRLTQVYAVYYINSMFTFGKLFRICHHSKLC